MFDTLRHFSTAKRLGVRQLLHWRMPQLPLWYPWICPKDVYILRTGLIKASVRNMLSSIGQNTLPHRGPSLDLRRSISRPDEAGQIHTRLDPERPARSRN